MSDPLISRIAETSKIWVSRSSLGRKDFSIELAIEIDGENQWLVLGRPFLGIDERAWGMLRPITYLKKEKSDLVELEILKICICVSKVHINYAAINEFLSIDYVIFTAKNGFSLKIFSDIDSFEVPCINSELTETRNINE